MSLTDFLHELQKDAEQNIKRIETIEKDILKRAYLCAFVFAEANSRLKTYIIGYEFESEKEEIHFFKYSKPKLVSRLVYYCQVYNIELNRPKGGTEVQREYINGELKNLQDYVGRRPEFYSYYRLEASHNDVFYFTRGRMEIGRQYLEPTFSEREPMYSTNCDYKMAKIIANEQLEILLRSQLDELERPKEEKAKLHWVAKKTFLIELLYGLDSLKVFGRMPLKRLVTIAQWLCGINLGNYSSEFAKMCDRDNPTPFIDEMKEAVLRRMKREKGEKKK